MSSASSQFPRGRRATPTPRPHPLALPCAPLLVLALAGCITVREPDPALALVAPAAWNHAQDWPQPNSEAELAHWWRQFDDPRLSQLVEAALEHNPDIASAVAAVEETRARRRALQAELLPRLNGSAGASHNESWQDGSRGDSGESFSLGLDSAWDLDLFGANRLQIRSSSAQVGAAEANAAAVRSALAAETALAYVNLRAAERQLVTVQRSLELQQESWQLASWRAQSGVADGLEAARALTGLEQSRAQLPQIRQTVEQARNLLSRLAGSVPGSADGAVAAGTARIPRPPRHLDSGIPAAALARRPDVRQAAWNWAAAVAATDAAAAERFPSLNLSGNLGLDSDALDRLADPQQAALGLAANLTGPIFDGGRIRATVRANSAAEEQAMQAYRQAALTALQEVEDALIASRRSAERIERLTAAVNAARDAAELARQQYSAGTIDFTTVLDTQRTLLDLEQAEVSAQADRTTATVELFRALGGGW